MPVETRSGVRRRRPHPSPAPVPTDPAMDNQAFDPETNSSNQTPNGQSAPNQNGSSRNGGVPLEDIDVTTRGILQSFNDDIQETSLSQPLLAHEDDYESEGHESEGVVIEYPKIVGVTPDESAWQIALQVSIPYFIAGFGMVLAGMLLDRVQHWTVFVEVSEIFILVPALLGLKGNLEMTLASRLSTQANLGNMDSRSDQIKMILGNLALTQVQAIVVGFLASMAAMIFGWIPKGKFDIYHGFLLCASSVMTAALASLILGTIMILVILASRKLHINPDNVATPIAASLGDITTLALLSTIAAGLYKVMKTIPWLAPTLLFLFLALTPLWWVVSHKNKFVHNVLYTGWTPVIGAMIISSMGGLILDFTVANYPGIAVFQPVINGVGGNLVAVQASRLSTSLHLRSTPGSLPESSIQGCPNICQVFFNSGVIARTSRVLMLMVVPGHLVFIYTIHYLQDGDLHTPITIFFCISYLIAATIQVAVLLYISVWLVHWLWKRGNDPDNFSIPYLTALGDLLGTGLLALAFHLLVTLGDKSIIEVATGSGDGALSDGGL